MTDIRPVPGGDTDTWGPITLDWLGVSIADDGTLTDAAVAQTGGVPPLSLSYNGNGPVSCQVLDGLAWDPSAGGYLYAILPDALTSFGHDAPAVCDVDDTGTIQSFLITMPGSALVGIEAFGPTGLATSPLVVGLQVNDSDGNPGNTPEGIIATQDMIVGDNTNGGVWFCTVGYDPIAPTDAVWVFLSGSASGVEGYPPATGQNSFAQGEIESSGAIDSSGGGSFAQGYATGAGALLTATEAGAFAQGYAGPGSTIEATDPGAVAQGRADGGGVIHASSFGAFALGYSHNTDALIDTSGTGAFAMGYAGFGGYLVASTVGAVAQGFANGAGSAITASAAGASAQGAASAAGTITATGEASAPFAQGFATSAGAITSSASGSFAQGSANGASAAITASGTACFAQGYAQDGGLLTSSSIACFVQGYADKGTIAAGGSGSFAQGTSNKSGSAITASNAGSFAQGFADTAGVITSSGAGSFAQGYSTGTGAAITSSASGSFAQGYANGAGAAITAAGNGSFAQGYALVGTISAAGNGAFAQGYAASGFNIEAAANNAVQFGPGINVQANSLQVGNAGIRFLGIVGPPTTPQAGDLWLDAIPALHIGTGAIVLDSLPTADPANVGQLWNNLGILTVSAG